MGVTPTGWLADALGSCGVDVRDVDVERDELCQEDVLTFSAESFSEATLGSLADLYLTFPSRFVFSSDDLGDAFQRTVAQSPKMLSLLNQLRVEQFDWLKARGLSTFRPFVPGDESVSDFAGRLEAACGFEAGELLSTHDGKTISIDPKNPDKLSFDDFKTLTALFDTFTPNLRSHIIGEDRD